jgi:DNA-directed RNA polymerase specialized sigma24 family protein
MSDPADSIAVWYDRLQAGDSAAAAALWARYFPRLVGLARAKLAGLPRKASADEEDVALSAFDSFCRRAKGGGFPAVADRDDLWRVLATVASRKAARLVRDQNRQKRGGGQVSGESVFEAAGGSAAGIGGVAGADLPPAVEAELADEFLRLLDGLGDDELRTIALWKMEGYTNAEIGQRLNKAVATVERRLALIRKTWERADADPPGA